MPNPSMNDRSRQTLPWLAVAAIVFLGLLLLFFAADQSTETADPARQNLSWPVLQTIVAFVLFDLAILAGLVIARLRSRPTSLSPKGLLALAAAASFLALGLLLVVTPNWPLAPADLLWTLVLISGFGFLLAGALAWSTWRGTPKRPQPVADTNEPLPAQAPAAPDTVFDAPVHQATTEASADDLAPQVDANLTYLTTLLGGDAVAAERLVAHEQALDPGASHGECVVRAVTKLLRDRM